MDEAALKRILPYSQEAEKSVVGSMMISNDAIIAASEILKPDDFYVRQYGFLFEAIVSLFNEGNVVDKVTLANKLKEMGAPEEVAGTDFIMDIISWTPTAANVKGYINIVANKSLMRKLIKTNQDIENMCYSESDTVDVVLDEAEKKIFEIVHKRNTGEYTPIRQIVKNAVDRIGLAARSEGSVTGIASGFTDLDYKTAGFQPSDLILIAARPSMGKTAFVLNIAQHVCFRLNKSAVIFSLEMSEEQLVNRLLSLESRVDSKSIRNGNVTAKDWEGIIEGASVIGESKLIIDATPGISIGELRSKCRKYKATEDIQIIFIDYLQLMSGSGKSESKQQEVADISRSLKSLARELNVPVIALSQLSRAVEKRDDHRPMLSDLRESGAIEQDADVVMFIYRDDYYNKDTEKKNVAEIIIAKQRNGPIGTTELIWLPELTKFANKVKD